MLPALALLALGLSSPALAAPIIMCPFASAPSERAAFATSAGVFALGTGFVVASRYMVANPGPGDYIPPIDQGVPIVVDEGAGIASDVMLFSGIGMAFLGSLSKSLGCGPKGKTHFAWATPFVESMGTAMLAFGIIDTTKRSVGRPRPYTRSGVSEGADDYESFFSGHAAMTAWGFGYGTSEMLRLASLKWWSRALIGSGAGFGIGVLTGSQRVQAAQHYWTDVLVGASVGTVIGQIPTLLDPAWERVGNGSMTLRGQVSTEGAMVRLSGAW